MRLPAFFRRYILRRPAIDVPTPTDLPWPDRVEQVRAMLAAFDARPTPDTEHPDKPGTPGAGTAHPERPER